uniref:Regulation of nuclear pre-mRNA domain containing 1B n=1 Tax=Cyprinus carpio carpio TaxID=630221 RepID=A0A9J8C177_CYPCA
MSSFSESALEKKLSELSNSQQSVQTLSLWIIHHRKHASFIVRVWHRELKKAKRSRKLTFLYLANDVIQNSKKKGPEFTKDFEGVLVDACSHVARDGDDGSKKQMERLLNIWQERNLYRADFIQQLKLAIEDSDSPKHKPADDRKNLKRSYQKVQEEEEEEDDDYRGHYSPQETDAAAPQLTEELVKALQDLENAASGDAAVRQKIASLPQEVQDVSLLEKITGESRRRNVGLSNRKWFSDEALHVVSSADKQAADKLSKTVDEACLLLAEYNGRLAAELEDRRQLARMLTEYIQSQRDALNERERKLEEYKQKLARVTQVRKELKSHIQSLPDLSLLPNVTGGLAPLPSAGDLFSTD